MSNLIIIGNGITGITVARNVRKKSDMDITVISYETEHFFSRTALMYVFMGHMRFEDTKPHEDWFWKKNRINLIKAKVIKIDTENKELTLDSNDKISYDKLVLATGSDSNKFGWPGQDLPGVQGLYSKQDLDILKDNTKGVRKAVIVGGGLIGIELAEMLHSRGIHVTFLVREQGYWSNILPSDESSLVGRHILEHGMQLKLSTKLNEITSGENGRVKSVITDKGEVIECQFVGLTAGVHPNIGVVKESNVNTNKGILVNEYFETNIESVYAAGDCAEIINPDDNKGNTVEQLWYTGRMQGEVLAETICGRRTKYNRGVLFNSAKFLDIEYQTYGYVRSVLREGEESFYWEAPNKRRCLRFVFDKVNKTVTGVNALGIRFRHRVFESWIEDKKTIDFVLENLEKANFDPEFFRGYKTSLINSFNEHRKSVKV